MAPDSRDKTIRDLWQGGRGRGCWCCLTYSISLQFTYCFENFMFSSLLLKHQPNFGSIATGMIIIFSGAKLKLTCTPTLPPSFLSSASAWCSRRACCSCAASETGLRFHLGTNWGHSIDIRRGQSPRTGHPTSPHSLPAPD